MKKLQLITLLLMLVRLASAQQNVPIKPMAAGSETKKVSITRKIESTDKNGVTTTETQTTESVKSFPRFALYGIGDVNTQSLSQLNASGKLSAYMVPFRTSVGKKSKVDFITALYLSFNVNATNKDTLVQSTVMFPDLGNSSFLGTIEGGFLTNKDHESNKGFSYYYGLLGEFVTKKIRSKGDSLVYFNVNSVTAGIKLGYYYKDPSNENAPLISVTGVLYYNYIHIPDKDLSDYRYILKQPSLDGTLESIGFKVTFGINNLQFFADMRNTSYSGTVVLDRQLSSFNSNIGVILPVEILVKN